MSKRAAQGASGLPVTATPAAAPQAEVTAPHTTSPTIYQVAEQAGVSIATVSRVLQGSPLVADKSRVKVLDAVESLGYMPSGAARSLAVRSHEAIGLVLPELHGPYYAELLVGFESRAAELGLAVSLVLADGKDSPLQAARQLAARVDALAILVSSSLPVDLIPSLVRAKPVVLLSGDTGDVAPEVDAIGTDNTDKAETLTRHLLDHGRRDLRFVGDPELAPDIEGRYRGFVAAHVALGLTPAEPVRTGLREVDGREYAVRLLGRQTHRPEGLVCANDELALAILTSLTDAGVDVPQDLALVGWDDVMTAQYVRPALTTVRQPVQDMGALAADRLQARIRGAPARGERTVLSTELIVRNSCGCPISPRRSDEPQISSRQSSSPTSRAANGSPSPRK